MSNENKLKAGVNSRFIFDIVESVFWKSSGFFKMETFGWNLGYLVFW